MRSHGGSWPALAGVVAAFSVSVGCDVNIGLETTGVTARDQRRFEVQGTPDVTVKTFDGSIDVRAWDRPEVVIEVEKRASDKAALEAIELVADQSGDRITFEARLPERDRRVVTIGVHVSPQARLVASVPRETNLSLWSGDGSIHIERVKGRVAIESGDGSIKGIDLAGDLRVRTSDGSVTLQGVSGRADVETDDGGVKLWGRLERLRLRTGDGSVWVRADEGSTVGEDWEIRTGDGGVSLEVPPLFDADLDADAPGGRVHLDQLTLASSTESGRHAVKGRIGAGGGALRVSTGDGTITIRRTREGRQ